MRIFTTKSKPLDLVEFMESGNMLDDEPIQFEERLERLKGSELSHIKGYNMGNVSKKLLNITISEIRSLAKVHPNTASFMKKLYRPSYGYEHKPSVRTPIKLIPGVEHNDFKVISGLPLLNKKNKTTSYLYRVECLRCSSVLKVSLTVILGKLDRSCCCELSDISTLQEAKQHKRRLLYSAYLTRSEGGCCGKGVCQNIRHCSDRNYECECLGYNPEGIEMYAKSSTVLGVVPFKIPYT